MRLEKEKEHLGESMLLWSQGVVVMGRSRNSKILGVWKMQLALQGWLQPYTHPLWADCTVATAAGQYSL